MHREAERQLAQGLSRGARWTIGAFALLVIVTSISSALETPEPTPMVLIAIGAGVIAVPCFAPAPIARIAGRVIGAAVFCAGVAYLIEQLSGGALITGRRSQPGVLNAVMFLLVFGLPGACYAWRGRFRDPDDLDEVDTPDKPGAGGHDPRT